MKPTTESDATDVSRVQVGNISLLHEDGDGRFSAVKNKESSKVID